VGSGAAVAVLCVDVDVGVDVGVVSTTKRAREAERALMAFRPRGRWQAGKVSLSE
jgi:hypothetical protein